MSTNDRNDSETQICFEGPGVADATTLAIKGIKPELINRPEKILQLMDVLDLPKGTKARVMYTTTDVIVR
ncbi:hypothetical protein [Methylocystis hirsuta]|uniref:Uncharacterized protein n=1 Tax=Methylocystis hirsuta TaxID=369798 RepID=A0A3M9XIT0_9HYPH|nr:hypothetical protein [Methylocystis hirsuta]RNJ48033.1 hypothetical protein D1O30_19505 [Methylocystis hirsuta]